MVSREGATTARERFVSYASSTMTAPIRAMTNNYPPNGARGSMRASTPSTERWSGDASDSKLGLNIGAGVEVPLNNNLGFKVEYNYKTQYDGLSTLNIGLVFPL